jgi:hypothetical protein
MITKTDAAHDRCMPAHRASATAPRDADLGDF